MSQLLQQIAGVARGCWLASCFFWQSVLAVHSLREAARHLSMKSGALDDALCAGGRDSERDIVECQTLLDVSHEPLGRKSPQQGVCHARISSNHALNLAGVESDPVSASCSQGHACAHALYDLLPMTVRLGSLGRLYDTG